MTNLCVEVTHPTTPLKHIDDPKGEIGICVLSAVNLLEIKDFTELESVCDIIVRLLDSVIDLQDYPVLAAENFTKNRRSLAVGVSNLAGLLAKNKLKYDNPNVYNFIDEWMENLQYYLLKASCNLAKELGPCNKFDRTKYYDGIFPLDTYCKKVDKIVSRKPSLDWKFLRKEVKEHGLRHSTVTAQMPCESSSVIQNSTNGIEPVRSLISYKKSKQGALKQIVPGFYHYKNFYTMAWDIKDNKCLINLASVIQKWMDMSLSFNTYYNYSHYDMDTGLPLSVLVKDMIYCYQMGLKTHYYTNTEDGDKSVDLIEEVTSGCGS
jgi:ribonucleoside-diphosphate reductase alpha chain